MDYVLHNSFSSDGTQICYTVPSAQQGAADLYLYSFGSGDGRLLLQGALAHGTVPAWYRGDKAIVYHSPEAQIEIFYLQTGQREIVTRGTLPAVRADGKRIAFYRDDQVYVWDIDRRKESLVPTKSRLRKRALTNGLSWSVDGQYLSFGATVGLVGKETAFFLSEISSSDIRKIDVAYLTGLSLIN
jgi:Tol biopolymer transport system component